MSMHDLSHILTEDITRLCNLAQDCHMTRSLGIVTGTNGVGKTEALKTVQRRWKKFDLPGEAFYLRATQIRGYTSGIKDLLEAMGRRQAGANASGSLGFTLKICRLELERQNIRGLLLDEADLWGAEGLSALVALYDSCLDRGQPLTILLASSADPSGWMQVLAAGRSRTLRRLEMKAMPIETMLGVLRAWGNGLEDLAGQVSANDPTAIKTATRLHTHTGGIFRRLSFFAALHRRHCQGEPVTMTSLEKVLSLMSGIA